jgi:hypothetical protein
MPGTGPVVDQPTATELNISRHEADVAIRGSRPMRGDFIIRKLAVIGFAVYESARMEVGTGRDWVAYNEELMQLPEMRWLETHMEGGRIRLRNSGMGTLCGAIASGIGRGVLPCFIGDRHSELRRSPPGDPVLSRDSWLLIHREARVSARVAVVADWLVERFTADARLCSRLVRDTVTSPQVEELAPGRPNREVAPEIRFPALTGLRRTRWSRRTIRRKQRRRVHTPSSVQGEIVLPWNRGTPPLEAFSGLRLWRA